MEGGRTRGGRGVCREAWDGGRGRGGRASTMARLEKRASGSITLPSVMVHNVGGGANTSDAANEGVVRDASEGGEVPNEQKKGIHPLATCDHFVDLCTRFESSNTVRRGHV